MKTHIIIAFIIFMMPALSLAQYTGPVAERAELTVEKVGEVRIGTYAVVTGQIINQLGEDYYTFQDGTGEIRVEISPGLWKNRTVNSETTVRLHVEVDSNIFGRRYLWVESLEVLGSE